MVAPSVEELERRILSVLEPRRLKVARLVLAATNDLTDFGEMDETEVKNRIDKALARVAVRDGVCVHGDITNWRFSEIHNSKTID